MSAILEANIVQIEGAAISPDEKYDLLGELEQLLTIYTDLPDRGISIKALNP